MVCTVPAVIDCSDRGGVVKAITFADYGAGKRIFCAILCYKQSCYQDRLGTNVAKALKTEMRVSQARQPVAAAALLTGTAAQRIAWRWCESFVW
jgi:hypothetical protein